MGDRVEREFKIPLATEAQFTAVLARLRGLGAAVSSAVVQVNHFFDTEELGLRAQGIALRLRAEAGRHELCLKGPSQGAGALASRAEEELGLDASTAKALLAGKGSAMAVFAESSLAGTALVRRAREIVGKQPLAYLGSFENERTRIGPARLPGEPALPPLLFELDRTRFSAGRVERELEVELPAGADAVRAEEVLRTFFRELELVPRSVPSKAERFFGALDEGS